MNFSNVENMKKYGKEKENPKVKLPYFTLLITQCVL